MKNTKNEWARLSCKAKRFVFGHVLGASLAAGAVAAFLYMAGGGASAQSQPNDRPDGPPGFDGPPPFGAPGGGPGGMMQTTELVPKFDTDGDKRLNAAERKAAFDSLSAQGDSRQGRRGPRGPGPQGNQGTPEPGQKLTPADVKTFPEAGLYDPATLRTLFLDFDDSNWEKELAAFKNTDVDIPAKLTVDGTAYPDVGVHFRGMSSFMMVGEGRKRSLKLSLDFVHKDQQLRGRRTVDLLNCHEDPSFLRSVLSLQIARESMPAPQANLVRVVINGESWGVYANVEAFNKDFVQDRFGTKKGTRWKAPGSPMGRASLAYLGEDVAPYKKLYELKSKDEPQAWADLVRLCRVLNETPADQLEQALGPVLDVDGALRFLAWENVLINNDGYWIRNSDYNLYQDTKGRFHIIPHDSNETFSVPGGPGFGRGPGGPQDRRPQGGMDGPGAGPGRGGRGPGMAGGARVEGVKLDPLVAANDPGKPLISKLLTVPALRSRYLGYTREMADKWLDWRKLGPIARQYSYLIAADVRADTRKLDSTEAFKKALEDDTNGGGGHGGSIALKRFADERRAFLLGLDPAAQAKR